MEIKIVGNKNPSGHGQGGVVYDAEGITGALNVAKATAPNVAVRGVAIAYDEQNNTLRTDGTIGTLTTDGSSPKHNNRVIVGRNSVVIRRLTPRECWRLQGFPDEYFDKAKAAGISDTQLYKMAGNAVTVNVARAIGEKLKEIEDEET